MDKLNKNLVSPIWFIFGERLALVYKIHLAKFEVHHVKGLKEIAGANFKSGVPF